MPTTNICKQWNNRTPRAEHACVARDDGRVMVLLVSKKNCLSTTATVKGSPLNLEEVLISQLHLCNQRAKELSTWWITKNTVGIHRMFRISRATSMQEAIGQLVLITFVPIWDWQAEKPSFRNELMRVPSGGELTFARLEISSSLIYPGGSCGSLSSIIVLRSFSKVTPFSLVYAHPHSLAKLSISARKEASWRGPVHRGPTTDIESASYCSVCTATWNLPQLIKSKSLRLATTLAMTNEAIITDAIIFSIA